MWQVCQSKNDLKFSISFLSVSGVSGSRSQALMRRDLELDQVYCVADRVDVHCLYQVQFFFISGTVADVSVLE